MKRTRRERILGILVILSMVGYVFLSSFSPLMATGNAQLTGSTIDAPIDAEFSENTLTLYAFNREASLEIGNYYLPLYTQRSADRVSVKYLDYDLEIYATSIGVEFDLVVASNPGLDAVYVLPLTLENLDAYYQPPLNEEILFKGWTVNATHAIDENGTLRDYRPIEKVGSWAFYLQGKRGNQYTTGKAFHLDAPYIYDASGLVTAYGEIEIAEGELRISVPNYVFQFGTYPITIDPSFGKTDVGASTYSVAADYSVTLRTANPEPDVVNVQSITAYILQDQSGTRQAKVALYDHDAGNDRAGDLLDDSDEENFGYNFDNWRTFAGSSYAGLASGPAWLAILVDDVMKIRYDSGGTNYWRSKSGFTYPTFGDPWGPPSWSTSREFSIYANYTAPPILPPNNTAFEIPDRETGDLIYTNTWYTYRATVTQNNYTVSAVSVGFTDGTTWSNFTWDVSGFTRDNGYEISEINATESTNATAGGVWTIDFRIMVKSSIDDVLDVDYYLRSTDNASNTYGWELVEADYVDIQRQPPGAGLTEAQAFNAALPLVAVCIAVAAALAYYFGNAR